MPSRLTSVTLTDPHFKPMNHAARWRALAAHLRTHPEGFHTALENIERWKQWGRTHPAPLHAWQQKIQYALSSPDSMDSFLDWLAEDNVDSETLKSCSPFAGVIVPHSAS